MKVPLLDLKKQYERIQDDVLSAIKEVCDSQYFVLGPKVAQLESEIAAYCQCPYAVGVSSGTDALLISLMAAGIGHGDLVVTTPYTFFATVGAIVRLGAKPVFVDIHKDTFNMDPSKLAPTVDSMDKDRRARLKAIVPVHLFGQCANMEPILRVAGEYGLTVIEDAAQAIGAEYGFSGGSVKRAGSMGQYGCFSFFPSKNLGAFGDGGMVTTCEDDVHDRLKIMRVHGSKPKYFHKMVGGNFRLDALQAAVLLVKLRHLDEWTSQRRENAKRYGELFGAKAPEGLVSLPKDIEKRHIYNQFVIKVQDQRDELRAFLLEQGVGSEIYYPVPLHMQDCFESLGHRAMDFPVSVEAAQNTLALPIYPELTPAQMEYVVDKIVEFFK